jgi:hypothetical protein
LGTTGNIVTGSASKDTIAFTAATTGNHSINLAGSDDTVTAANLIAAGDTVAGGAGNDTLSYASSVDVVSTGLTLISGFDTIALADDTANSAVAVTLTNAVVASSDAATITVTAAGADDVVTINANLTVGNVLILGDTASSYTLGNGQNNRVTIGASADVTATGNGIADETTAVVTLGTADDIVTGSGSIDTVVLSTGSATLSLGAADDVVQSTTANFDGFNTIEGGSGNDTISITDAVTVIDNGFTSITSIEKLLLSNNTNAVTLGAKAAAAGISTITGGTGADTITLVAGFTNNVTITGAAGANVLALGAFTGTANITLGDTGSSAVLGSGATTVSAGTGIDTITIGAGTVNLTLGDTGADIVIFTNGQISSVDTIAGGTGSDVLRTSGAVTMIDADFTRITATEIIDAATNDGALSVTLSTLAQAAGILTVNGGDGIDTINTSGYTVAVTITGAVGADTITTGAAAANITGGTGADIVTLGAANAVVDTLVIATGDSTGTIAGSGNAGTITGYDIVTNFALHSDVLDLQGTAIAATLATADGAADSTLTIGGAVVGKHTLIAGGIYTFQLSSTGTGGTAAITDNASLAAVVQYITLTDFGSAADTLAFTGTIGGVAQTWVYSQVGNGTGAVDGYTLVQLAGVTATGVDATAAAGVIDIS